MVNVFDLVPHDEWDDDGDEDLDPIETPRPALAAVPDGDDDDFDVPVDPYDVEPWDPNDPVIEPVVHRVTTLVPVSETAADVAEVAEVDQQPGRPAWAVEVAPQESLWSLRDYAAAGLTLAHAAKLQDSGVAPLVAAARPYVQVDNDTLADSEKNWALPRKTTKQGKRFYGYVPAGGVMLMPWYSPDDIALALRAEEEPRHSSLQYRPAKPVADDNGRERKYEFVLGSTTPIGMHPATPTAWIDTTPVVLLAEGMLKGDSALTAMLLAAGTTPDELRWDGGPLVTARAHVAALLDRVPEHGRAMILTIAGVDNWKNNSEWRSMDFRGRTVWVGVDGDVSSNPHVHRAMRELWEFLTTKKRPGALNLLAPIVTLAEGQKKVGIDDYLAKHGDWGSLIAMRQDSLPDRPDSVGLVGPVGTEVLLPDRSRCVTNRHIVLAATDEVTGETIPKERVSPVLGAIIEIISTEVIADGYGSDARSQTKHDLRVTLPGHEAVTVHGWPDEDLGKIEEILAQAGGTHAVWHERAVPYVQADIKRCIRATRAEDYTPGFAIGRTGLAPLPPGHEPEPADRPDSDLLDPNAAKAPGRPWVWVDEDGAIGPDWLDTPEARADLGDGIGDRFPIPEWQPPLKVAADLHTFLDETMGAYNDPALRHVHMAKFAYVLAGGKKSGGVYAWGPPGCGKTKDGEFTNGLCFYRGEPFSVVNDTTNYLPSIPDSRSHILVAAGDVKRMAGDERTWPGTAKAASTFLRRDYDGPGASRGRNAGKDGDFKASRRNPAYPGIILDGELPPFFDESTMQKSVTIALDMAYIKPGQAKGVLERQVHEGLPSRMGRSYISWIVGRIPKWLGGGEQSVQALDRFWSAQVRKVPASMVGSMRLLGDEQVALIKDWSPRQHDILAALMIGNRLLCEWMRAVVVATSDEDLDAKVAIYERTAAHSLFRTLAAHADRITGDGVDPDEQVFERLRIAIAQGGAVVQGFAPSIVNGAETHHGTLIGKRMDEEYVDVLLEPIAEVTGLEVNTVRAALQRRALKVGGKYAHATRFGGDGSPRLPAYRITNADLFGVDERDDVEGEIAHLEAKLEHVQMLLDEARARRQQER